MNSNLLEVKVFTKGHSREDLSEAIEWCDEYLNTFNNEHGGLLNSSDALVVSIYLCNNYPPEIVEKTIKYLLERVPVQGSALCEALYNWDKQINNVVKVYTYGKSSTIRVRLEHVEFRVEIVLRMKKLFQTELNKRLEAAAKRKANKHEI